MNHVIEHTQCPRCATHGHDRTKDNLAVYSDGSKYCFRCHYLVLASAKSRIKKEFSGVTRTPPDTVVLPSDVSLTLPGKAKVFCSKFGLTTKDIVNNMIMWSDRLDRLIFPYFDADGLIGWQGRYLGEGSVAKWFSQGDLREIYHYTGNRVSKTVVVVEDIISAIKVSHCKGLRAMPLFGTYVSTKRILQIKKTCDTMVVWLDLDAAAKSAKAVRHANSLGLTSATVITNVDPKAVDDDTIKALLADYTREG